MKFQPTCSLLLLVDLTTLSMDWHRFNELQSRWPLQMVYKLRNSPDTPLSRSSHELGCQIQVWYQSLFLIYSVTQFIRFICFIFLLLGFNWSVQPNTVPYVNDYNLPVVSYASSNRLLLWKVIFMKFPFLFQAYDYASQINHPYITPIGLGYPIRAYLPQLTGQIVILYIFHLYFI